MRPWGVPALLLLCQPVNGETPPEMSYQGKVTDVSGNPVPDGNYPMRFRILDAPTGGAPSGTAACIRQP